MKILSVRNVQEALPRALQLLEREGVERPSRNGPVLLGPSVTTVYTHPCERILFHPARDANPFYHLYEALWMLAGRNDIKSLSRYTKNVLNYSDDGSTWHGAYGYRWRHAGHYERFDYGKDQLKIIADTLSQNPDDRRCVLQMWDVDRDLGRTGKDFPCNVTATFQRGIDGELNLTVFCRSNDIIWGCYGANAVHFSFLLEYMALWIGCPVGMYTQVSVNWHAYLNILEQVKMVRPEFDGYIDNPYKDCNVYYDRMFHGTVEDADCRIHQLLSAVDRDFLEHIDGWRDDEPFFNAAYAVLKAHEMWRVNKDEARFIAALKILEIADHGNDWVAAATQWIQRRYDAWKMRFVLSGDASHL